jgi:hypothetical protein
VPQCLYSGALPLLPLMGRTAYTEPQCLYSRAIPLFPLWIVRPVQSLSACTVELYLYSPYGSYGLYRASVPLKGCTLTYYIITKHKTWNQDCLNSSHWNLFEARRTEFAPMRNLFSSNSLLFSYSDLQAEFLGIFHLNFRAPHSVHLILLDLMNPTGNNKLGNIRII